MIDFVTVSDQFGGTAYEEITKWQPIASEWEGNYRPATNQDRERRAVIGIALNDANVGEFVAAQRVIYPEFRP